METIKGRKQVYTLIFIIGLLLFTYTLIRAYILSFTWDESFSYIKYVRNGFVFLDKYDLMDANNHILNTWLNVYLIKLFGVSELVLRLPSLFAHILFLIFSFKLVKDFQSHWLVVTSFLVINLNPYLLDFFSLSRGYGLSIGLMMASIYYLYAFYIKEYKLQYALLSILFGLLASLASFVLLNYFLVSFGLLILFMCYSVMKLDKTRKEKLLLFLKSASIPALIFFFSLLLIVPITLKLKDAGALFYGGEKGFWKDTVNTITDKCFYELDYNYWFQRIAKGFMSVILFSGTVFVIINFIKKKITNNNLFLFSLLLLIGLCALSTIVQHELLGTLYLIGRTGLFFVVLFNLFFVFLINEISKKNSKFSFIIYLVSAIVILHFILCVNFSYVLEWKGNADIKQMVTDFDQIKINESSNQKPVRFYIPFSLEQGINFYRVTNFKSWLGIAEISHSVIFNAEYLYLEPKHYAKINMDSFEIIKKYPITNTILAKPKYAPLPLKIYINSKLNYENTTEGKYIITKENQYSPGFSYIINDSMLENKNAELVFKTTVMAPTILDCNLSIIVSIENKNGTYFWENAFIRDYIRKQNEWADVYVSYLVPKEIKAGDVLKSYIWNPDKHQLYIKNMEFKWLTNR